MFFWWQISTEAQGKTWSAELSPARNYVPHSVPGRLATSSSSPRLDSSMGRETTAAPGGTAKMTSARSFTSATNSSLEQSLGFSRSDKSACHQRHRCYHL